MGKNNINVKKIAYFTKGELITPLTQLRVVGPMNFNNIEIKSNFNINDFEEDALNDVNLIVLQRDFPEDLSFCKKIMKFSESLKIPTVYDLDDHLLALPENHPDRLSHHFTRSLLPMYEALIAADYVTVSTEKLKDTLKSINENIFVLPNFLDDSLWPFHLPIRNKRKDNITIGYMGGESHKPDIEWVAPVLEKLNQNFDGEINFIFYGVKPPEELFSLPNVKYTDLKTYNYKEFISDFHHLDVDIFIAPLIDNLFNQCKSPIKFLEYSTMGVPAVFSNIEPYNTIIINGENGLLAKSLDEWYEKLVSLIQDPDLRYRLAKNAQESIRSNWLMSENAHLWRETYNNFILIGRQKRENKRNQLRILSSISRQIHDFDDHQKQNISENINLLKEKSSESQSLKVDLNLKEETIQTNNQELSKQKQIIQSLTEKLREQEESNENLKMQLSDQINIVQSLKDKISELEYAIQNITEQLSDHKNIKQKQSKFISKLEKENSDLLEGLGERDKTIQILNENKTAKEIANQSLSNQLAQKEQTIQSINAQLSEKERILSFNNTQLSEKTHMIEMFNDQINNQENQIGSLNNKILKLEEEILFYSLSKSWRLTRPFRAIMKKLKGNKDV